MIANSTPIKIALVLGVVILFAIPITHAYALQQAAGTAKFDIKPGESDTFAWGLRSDDQAKTITVHLSTDGEGSQFLSFPESATIEPLGTIFVTIRVTIPDDYPGNIELKPKMFATEFGEEGGTTRINVRMVKSVNLSIHPNADPELRVDWQALKAQEEQAAASEIQPTQESGSPQEQADSEKVIEGTQITQQETSEATGPVSFGTPEVEMDEEPEMTQVETVESEAQVSGEQGGGCLIATAAFGSELAPQVQLLREIRDNTVLNTQSGTAFMTGFNQFYYSFSPTIADLERENPAFKEVVKITLTPLLTSLSILNYADIDSEEEMLTYGIGIILLNAGMYFAAPALLIVRLSKKKLTKTGFTNS